MSLRRGSTGRRRTVAAHPDDGMAPEFAQDAPPPFANKTKTGKSGRRRKPKPKPMDPRSPHDVDMGVNEADEYPHERREHQRQPPRANAPNNANGRLDNYMTRNAEPPNNNPGHFVHDDDMHHLGQPPVRQRGSSRGSGDPRNQPPRHSITPHGDMPFRERSPPPLMMGNEQPRMRQGRSRSHDATRRSGSIHSQAGSRGGGSVRSRVHPSAPIDRPYPPHPLPHPADSAILRPAPTKFIKNDIVRLMIGGNDDGEEGVVINHRTTRHGMQYLVTMANGSQETCVEDELVLVSADGGGQPLLPLRRGESPHPSVTRMNQRGPPLPLSRVRIEEPGPYIEYQLRVGRHCGMEHIDAFDLAAHEVVREARALIADADRMQHSVEMLKYADMILNNLYGLVNDLSRLYPLGPEALNERDDMVSSLTRIIDQLDDAINRALPPPPNNDGGPVMPQVPSEIGPPADDDAHPIVDAGLPPSSRAGFGPGARVGQGARGRGRVPPVAMATKTAGDDEFGAHRWQSPRAARQTNLKERSTSGDDEGFQQRPASGRRGSRGKGGNAKRLAPMHPQQKQQKQQQQRQAQPPASGPRGGGGQRHNQSESKVEADDDVSGDSDSDFETMSASLRLTSHVAENEFCPPGTNAARDREIARGKIALSPVHSTFSGDRLGLCNMPKKKCKLKAVNKANGRCHLHGGKVLCKATGARKCRAIAADGLDFCVKCAKNGGKIRGCGKRGCKVAPGKNSYFCHLHIPGENNDSKKNKNDKKKARGTNKSNADEDNEFNKNNSAVEEEEEDNFNDAIEFKNMDDEAPTQSKSKSKADADAATCDGLSSWTKSPSSKKRSAEAKPSSAPSSSNSGMVATAANNNKKKRWINNSE